MQRALCIVDERVSYMMASLTSAEKDLESVVDFQVVQAQLFLK